MDTEQFGVTVDRCLRSKPSYLACKMTLKARGGNPLLGRPGLGDHQKYRGQNWSVVREEKSPTDCSDISLRDLGSLHQLLLCWVASVWEGLCFSLDWVSSLCIPVLTDFAGVISGRYRCKMRAWVSVYIVHIRLISF